MSLSSDTRDQPAILPRDWTLRVALAAFLESGETDHRALGCLVNLPDGMEALERARAIKAALAPMAVTGPSVDQYLEWKREEIEAERQRDERRNAECA